MTWKQRKVVQIQGHYSVWPVYTWVMNQCLMSLCKKGDTHTHTHAIKSFWNRLECLPKQRVKWSKKRDGSVWCGLLSQRWFLPHLEFPRKNSSVFWAWSAACIRQPCFPPCEAEMKGGGWVMWLDALAEDTEITIHFLEFFVGCLLHEGALVSPEKEQDEEHKGHQDI